jgi:hypothetical protein
LNWIDAQAVGEVIPEKVGERGEGAEVDEELEFGELHEQAVNSEQ